ncbi:MAG TPA: C25 family cysteine peptidase, partial [Chloroflexia bacterium]|nr:C25 family cysteine peptidase [Chloroflexia bacterium]
SFNAGRALINYYGHSNYLDWGRVQNIFDTSEFGQITNAGHESFLTAMTCFAGGYDYPSSIVSDLLLKSSGGIIGGVGASSESEASGQVPLNTAFYQSILAGQSVGDALRAGYRATPDHDVQLQFNLLGDPALHVDLGQ